ncbi:hypothetical protein Ddye_029651 [Dipteronia dyeriana]|uniref:Endonuclease/exonuclease/phosphatase domain-containing protein n=1 Tax=Dipteronia dyeriana TaxID=168575 RepID=A0AAD9WKS6_9ROSI|nr:hypothetical protein Ddye_029651 [Dipteronia dyeriana]
MVTRSSKINKEPNGQNANLNGVDTGKVFWNLEDQIARVIEKGVAMGSDMKTNACIHNQRCITLTGELLKIKKDIVFCNVCAANVENDRKELWEFIAASRNSFPMPWCIGGDFNTVLEPSERKCGQSNMVSMSNFRSFLPNMEVVDILLHGVSFTRTNHREKVSWVRLDRFLISPTILSWLPDLVQVGLPLSISDHNAIMIGGGGGGGRKIGEKNDRIKKKDLVREAIKGWQDCKVAGSKGFILSSKIKAFKISIKRWLSLNPKPVSPIKLMEDNLVEVERKAFIEG